MILHSIELENFGCFLEPARFTLAPDRPNLITGPNGAGKSTLLGALSAAFVISHRSEKQDILRWQPWGRSLAPRVAVEFESGGARYRLTKVFLQRPQALLEEERPQGFMRLAQGDAVEERLPAFLGGAGHRSSDARARQWLQAGLLWVPQNQLLQTEVDGAIQESIRGAFGVQTRSSALQRILDEVAAQYAQDWTEKKEQPRKNSPLATLPGEIDRLEREVAGLKARLDELDTVRNRYAELTESIRTLQGNRERAEHELKELEQQTQQRRELEARLREEQLRKQQAEADYGRLQAILDARATLASRRQDARQRRQERAAAVEAAQAALKAAEEALQTARDSCLQQQASLGQQLEQLRAPSPAVLSRLEQLSTLKKELTAKLESALLHAEILPEADGRLEVLEGEPGGWVELRRDQAARISGSPRIELRIPGFGRLRLSGPAESAAELRDRLNEAGREWARATEPFGGAGLEQLRDRRQRADALALALDRAKNALSAHEHGTSPEAVALNAARQRLHDAQALLEQTEQELRKLDEEATQLASEPRTDAAIRQEMDGLALSAHGLGMSIHELQQQLSAFPADLEQRLGRARRSLEELDRRLEELDRQLQQERDRLNQLQGQAVYDRLAESEALLEQKKSELARERLRAGANKLLKQTLDAVLEEMQQQVLPRVEQRAAALLREITGGFAESISLAGGSWAPQAVRPAAAPMEVEPDLISGGEQEQLHLAVRLALADILTENEPFPVVLDDALLSTDEERLGRILDLLGQRQSRMQWLILTCHPERFAALTDAHWIRLGRRPAAG